MRSASSKFGDNASLIWSLLTTWIESKQPYVEIAIGSFIWHCVAGTIDSFLDTVSSSRNFGQSGTAGLITYIITTFDYENVTRQNLECLALAEIIILPDEDCLDALIKAANKLNFEKPLPEHIVFRNEVENMMSLASEIAAKRSRSVIAAGTEKLYQASLAKSVKVDSGLDDLAIIISTYNRGPFVELNVKWLLRQIDQSNLPVKCVVVDNASTDETFARLLPFHQHPKFVYICNSANTGMLGNLRVCSSKVVAKYIWLTGDDDYIANGAIQRTLDAISLNPGIPMLIHNFGVYHRERLGIGDIPEHFFNEIQLLASNPASSSVYPVNVVAGEHDNLFTAIYPLVFRSDLLAACFNYPFAGVPFGNLVECVPTTKFILETLPYADAYWFSEVGIVGNAHNSWSRHRPRWHLVLMPQILVLARDSGVDPKKVWQWSGIHRSLFFEAANIAENLQIPANLAAPEDFISASVFFRNAVEKPSGLKLTSDKN
jgi:glycosyltransferase involved in cell wall biosynthesis